MNREAHWLHRMIDEYMIDSEERKARGESANGRSRADEFADIAQMPVKCAIWSRTAQTVEVTEKNNGHTPGNAGLPLCAGEQLCLNEAFAPAKTEMRVDDVDVPDIGFVFHFNCVAY